MTWTSILERDQGRYRQHLPVQVSELNRVEGFAFLLQTFMEEAVSSLVSWCGSTRAVLIEHVDHRRKLFRES